MKRTKSINLSRMRKRHPAAKPLLLALSATTITACDCKVPATVYRDVADCVADTGRELRCETAYERALSKARRSGPKYQLLGDCESDFGRNNCEFHRDGSVTQAIPKTAGFMLARDDDEDSSAPVYTSYGRYSPYYGRWSSLDGKDLGRRQYGDLSVNKSNFSYKPAVTRTLSRGGFGSRSSFSGGFGWGG